MLIEFHGNKPGKLLKSRSVWNCLSSCSSTLRSHPLLKLCIFYRRPLKIRFFFFFGRRVAQHRQNSWKAHPRLKFNICTTWMRKLEAATSPCAKKWILQCSERCEGLNNNLPWLFTLFLLIKNSLSVKTKQSRRRFLRCCAQ